MRDVDRGFARAKNAMEARNESFSVMEGEESAKRGKRREEREGKMRGG